MTLDGAHRSERSTSHGSRAPPACRGDVAGHAPALAGFDLIEESMSASKPDQLGLLLRTSPTSSNTAIDQHPQPGTVELSRRQYAGMRRLTSSRRDEGQEPASSPPRRAVDDGGDGAARPSSTVRGTSTRHRSGPPDSRGRRGLDQPERVGLANGSTYVERPTCWAPRSTVSPATVRPPTTEPPEYMVLGRGCTADLGRFATRDPRRRGERSDKLSNYVQTGMVAGCPGGNGVRMRPHEPAGVVCDG